MFEKSSSEFNFERCSRTASSCSFHPGPPTLARTPPRRVIIENLPECSTRRSSLSFFKRSRRAPLRRPFKRAPCLAVPNRPVLIFGRKVASRDRLLELYKCLPIDELRSHRRPPPGRAKSERRRGGGGRRRLARPFARPPDSRRRRDVRRPPAALVLRTRSRRPSSGEDIVHLRPPSPSPPAPPPRTAGDGGGRGGRPSSFGLAPGFTAAVVLPRGGAGGDEDDGRSRPAAEAPPGRAPREAPPEVMDDVT